MGSILIHAGTAKAGSSSIQMWCSNSAESLGRLGIRPQRVRVADDGERRVRVSDIRPGHPVGAHSFIQSYMKAVTSARASEAKQLTDSLANELDVQVSRGGMVIVSGEGFWPLLTKTPQPFLQTLESLAAKHEIRVVAYLRAQDEALEAAWRFWGWRSGQSPSRFAERRLDVLDYGRVVDAARAAAPSVRFEPRAFSRSYFVGGDLVVDFACGVLGLSQPQGGLGQLWANRGLPLVAANRLATADPARFGLTRRSGDFERLTAVVEAMPRVPDPPSIEVSRRLLRTAMYERFEERNRALLGPGLDAALVEPPESPIDRPLADLDDLWQPDLDRAELAHYLDEVEAGVRSGLQ